jgi:hypothetical protein
MSDQPTTQCGAPAPEALAVCERNVNHAGAHANLASGNVVDWPNADEAPRTPPRGPSGGSRPDDGPDPYRVEALQAAAHWHIGSSSSSDYEPADVVRAAQAFEAYLRGER